MRKAALALEIVLAYVQARWLLHRRDVKATLAALRPRTEGGAQDVEAIPAGLRLGHATARTLSALPADSRCLMRSLVLSRLLDRRGIPSALVIGVRPGDTFGAHAWVEIAGRPVLPSGDDAFPRLVEL